MESSKSGRLSTINECINESISETEKKYFEEDNNFIDYFVEVGVKPEIFKNNYLYDSESINDINDKIVPQIITKFPRIDKKYIVIESTLIQQIFPHGFNAVEVEEKPDPEFYSIILDNQMFSAKYTHKYFACLLIYENIKDYAKLNEKYKNSDSLFKTFMNSKSQKEIKIKETEKKYKNYYIPKCLAIVSVHPTFNRFEEILRALYDLVLSNKYNNLYIDRIIEKMIVETPKLPRGYKKISLKLPNKTIDLTEKKMNDYPSINIKLSKLFGTLKMQNIIEIFRYLLFETKMIFFSSKLYDLTNTIMSILSLITPFKYQFQVVSVLPKELYHFIETISPYIFGINEAYDENFIKKNNITLEDTTICIVDIDQDKLYIISTDEKSKNEDFPEFPKHLKEKIEKDYNSYIQELISKARDNVSIKNIIHYKKSDSKDVKEDSEIYQSIFFNFMIFLLKDYPKFLSKDYGVSKDISMQVKDMIDTNAYLNSLNVADRDFYKRIFNTQMFIEFIFKRMMPKDCTEKVEILFFEEKINEKMNSKKLFGKSKIKEQNILLSSKEYDYDEQSIIIDCASEIGITQKVLENITKNKNLQKDFLNKGYDIELDEKNRVMHFKYHIFPSLLSDQLFSFNYQYYSIPKQYYKQIDSINTTIVNKSHLKFSNKALKMSEVGNDLYLCYLILWSITLWYTDSWEREFRFLKMIEVLEKVEGHEIEIFELIFKAIVNYCNDKDTVLLYKKFIHLNLNPTWSIFSLVSKIIKKKSNVKNKKELLSQQTKFKDLKSNSNIVLNKTTNEMDKFRSRTLKMRKVDDNILSEDVIFYAYGQCKYCNEYLSLVNLCSDLNQLKTKTEGGKDYFKCPRNHPKGNNNEFVHLKLGINFGVELYNQKIKVNRQSTSSNFVIELLSPSTMKKQLLKIAKDLGDRKFDVEMFKKNHKELFWNAVWFFELNNMDISFMLPYSYESCNFVNDDKSEKIKKAIITKNKRDIDVDIEKIINNPDIHANIIFYGNVEALGENITHEKIKNEVFSFVKDKYKMNDLAIQKIFQFYMSDKTGMISYLGFNSFSDNIGYNEFPDKFEEIKISENDASSFFSSRSNTKMSETMEIMSSFSSSSSSTILNSSINKSFLTKKSVNFKESYTSDKDSLNSKNKLNNGIKSILKNSKKIATTSVEISNKNEEIDFLAKFKESAKKIENGLKKDNKDKSENPSGFLRNSTLKSGILHDEKINDNE